jgi:hypothetical protein
VIHRAREYGIEVLIVIGGDGSMRLAHALMHKGLQVVGVPKTIDNDLYGTEVTVGFDTAVNTAMEALDKLHTTAESHHRVLVIEVMGRHAGWIALAAGVAGGADVILIPEMPYHLDVIADKIKQRNQSGAKFSLVVVAEQPQHVVQRDKAHDFLGCIHDHEPTDLMSSHAHESLCQRHVLWDTDRIGRHHISHQALQWRRLFGHDPYDQVTIREHPHRPVAFHDHKRPNLMMCRAFGRLMHRFLRAHRHHASCTGLSNGHTPLSLSCRQQIPLMLLEQNMCHANADTPPHVLVAWCVLLVRTPVEAARDLVEKRPVVT